MIALVRKISPSEQINGVKQCLDLFHFNEQEFFSNSETLSRDDKSFYGTIEDSIGIDWRRVHLRFSPEGKYFYAIADRKKIFMYELT